MGKKEGKDIPKGELLCAIGIGYVVDDQGVGLEEHKEAIAGYILDCVAKGNSVSSNLTCLKT